MEKLGLGRTVGSSGLRGECLGKRNGEWKLAECGRELTEPGRELTGCE